MKFDRASRQTLTIHREHYWATTSNKQLNVVQHIFSSLKMHSRAAVVLPDNVLFEGGAAETVHRELLKPGDLHTILRLPTGLFCAQGVKANVLFFDRKPPRPDGQPNMQRVWLYDLRTNQRFTLKTRPLQHADLDEFVRLYRADNRPTREATFSEANPQGRWRSHDASELLARDKASLDLFWLKDDCLSDSDNLAAPEAIAAEIVEDLQAALDPLKALEADLQPNLNAGARTPGQSRLRTYFRTGFQLHRNTPWTPARQPTACASKKSAMHSSATAWPPCWCRRAIRT